MRLKPSKVKNAVLAVAGIALLSLVPSQIARSNAQDTSPLVLSVQVEKGEFIYKVNGIQVETGKKNTLLQRLQQITAERGLQIPVLMVVDVQAPFTEFGKLETALDKIDLTSSRKFFVANFLNGTMNEIHWDEAGVPLRLN